MSDPEYSAFGLGYTNPMAIRDYRVRIPGRTTNFKRRDFSGEAQQWRLEVTLEPEPPFEGNGSAARIQGFQARRGIGTSFMVPMPQHPGLPIVEDSTVSVQAVLAAGAGVNRVMLTKTSAGDLQIQSGYFFKFAGHSKVYQCTFVTTLRGAAPAEMRFYPDLLEDLAIGDSLDFEPNLLVNWGEQTDYGMTAYDADGFFNYYAYFDEVV